MGATEGGDDIYIYVSMYSGATCPIDHFFANYDDVTVVAAVGGGDMVT